LGIVDGGGLGRQSRPINLQRDQVGEGLDEGQIGLREFSRAVQRFQHQHTEFALADAQRRGQGAAREHVRSEGARHHRAVSRAHVGHRLGHLGGRSQQMGHALVVHFAGDRLARPQPHGAHGVTVITENGLRAKQAGGGIPQHDRPDLSRLEDVRQFVHHRAEQGWEVKRGGERFRDLGEGVQLACAAFKFTLVHKSSGYLG